MKSRFKRRNGQTMVEYIIIVALIAISLIAIVGFFGQGLARKWAGATSALDDDSGGRAAGLVDGVTGDKIKGLKEDGSF